MLAHCLIDDICLPAFENIVITVFIYLFMHLFS